MTVPDSVRLKLNRAAKHLRELDEELWWYRAPAPYTLTFNLKEDDHSVMFFTFHVLVEPDERIGPIIGDCIHDMRSSLDHLACRLVEVGKGSTEHTQFPILDKRPTDKSGKAVLPNLAGGAAPPLLTFVDMLQPYMRGEVAAPGHPLAMLRDLSNADKHRLLHVTNAYLANAQCRLVLPDSRRIGTQSVGIAHDNTPVGVFSLPSNFVLNDFRDVYVEGQGEAFVAVKEPGPLGERPITIILEEILKFVWGDVIGKLESYLK